MFPELSIDEVLHAADIESLERRIMELALERCRARSGAIFLWDPKAKALTVGFHVVEGVTVNLPGARLRRRTDGRANGIAFVVTETNQPYVCPDTARDPNYARYFFDAASVAAVPIPYQGRAIGALTVSSHKRDAFTTHHIAALGEIA